MSEVETNPVEDLVQAATSQNYTAAAEIFNDVIGQKMQAALDQEKIAVANQIYNGIEPEEFDDEEVEVDEEDLDFDEDEDEVEN